MNACFSRRSVLKGTRRLGTLFFLVTLALFAAPAFAQNAPVALPALTVGRTTVAWTPANGLSLHIDGVPVVRKSTLYIVQKDWTGVLLDPAKVRPVITGWADAPLEKGPGAKTARIVLENENAACVYVLTAAPSDSVTVDLEYRLKKDIPAEIEYAAGYLSGPALQGTTGTAKTPVGNRPVLIAASPPEAGRTQEQNRLATDFSALTLETRLGRLNIAFSGDAPPPVLFDARADAQGWAREFPVFWLGIGSPSLPLSLADGLKRATFTFQIAAGAAPPVSGTAAAAIGEEGSRSVPPAPATSVVAAEEAYAPVMTATPLVIPRPKAITVTKEPFRLSAKTRIVIGDGASVGDKRGAELLKKEIATRFGLELSLARSRALVQGRDVIVIGEPKRNSALARLLVAERAVALPEGKSEGYSVSVTPRAVLIAGNDAAGSLWGAQTTIQLLAADRKGALIRGVRIADWPTLSLRAVHLFHGKDALPFHKKLIDRVLSRFKMNALFLQAEQLRWDTDPAVAPSWAGSKAQVREEIAFARQRGITTYPLLQSYGHMEWLFSNGRNREFAEDPQTPYAVNITNPKAVAYLEKFNAEADALFDAPGFHAGLDEVTMRGRFPFRSAPKTFSELFVQNARHWHGFFQKRGGKPLWMWADMALHPSVVAPSFGTAPSPEDAAKVREGLPKDIVMVDWQYGPHDRFPSLKLLKDSGFQKVVAATWFNPVNIQNFSKAAAGVGALGAMQTTWAGYESNEKALETPHRRQFTAFVLAADYFWNGGDGPAPGSLPYDPGEVFARQWQEGEAGAAANRIRPGFLVDLSHVVTRPLSDWLGYGPESGPALLPLGETRLDDGTLYRLPPGVTLLRGKLNPASAAPYPASREIFLGTKDRATGAIVGRQLQELRLLLAASHPVAPGTKIGTINITRDTGKTGVIDLIYGRNIAAWDDPQPLGGESPIAWRGKTGAGQTFHLRRLTWINTEPDIPLRSVTLTSADTEAAPALFGLTALE